MKRIRDEDRAEEVYLAHHDDIERAIAAECRRRRLPRDVAEQFSQDVRVLFVARGDRIIASYRRQSALSTYIFRVVSNYFLNWSEARSRRRLAQLADVPMALRAWPSKGVKEQAQEAALTNRVLTALNVERARLRTKEQLLLSLRFDAGLNIKTIASELNVTVKAAARRLERLIGSLRTRLVNSGLPRREVRDALEYLRDHGLPPPPRSS